MFHNYLYTFGDFSSSNSMYSCANCLYLPEMNILNDNKLRLRLNEIIILFT